MTDSPHSNDTPTDDDTRAAKDLQPADASPTADNDTPALVTDVDTPPDLLHDPGAGVLDGQPHRGCTGRYRLTVQETPVKVGRYAATVAAHVFNCSGCGDSRQTALQREHAQTRAMRAIRTTHQLLTPSLIRRGRTALGLDSKQLDRLLGLSEGFVRGFEKETYLQSPEVDRLLRDAFDDPAARIRMAAAAGMTLPTTDVATPGATPPAETRDPQEQSR